MITRWRYICSSVMITRWHYYIDTVMIARWRYYLNTVMTTRWQYCLRAEMITRWHYCISVKMVTGCVHWIVNVLTAKYFGFCRKKTSTSPNRRDRSLIRKTGGGTIEREERQRDRKSEKEGGRMHKEDKSLIDVEHVESTGERCCHLS